MAEAWRTWAYIGINSFGGPAGQIAVMHRVIVDDKQWLDEKRFLHALNFCMLLPGPEAMQLAVYMGWLLNGIRGAAVAGALFVLPGLFVIAVLAGVYSAYGNVSWIAALLFGIQAAVVAIVVQALVRVANRSLRTSFLASLATASFLTVFIFGLAFPVVVIVALIVGWLVGRRAPAVLGLHSQNDDDIDEISEPQAHRARLAGFAALVLWLLPLAVLAVGWGVDNLFTQQAWLFSKTAVISFGGAYAALAYVAQQAVQQYGWVEPRDMVAGLGLAETTPGPLVLVMPFIGYVSAYRLGDELGLPPALAGVIGLSVTAWVTFLPSFGFVLLGAPSVERLRHNRRVAGALAAVTACVVGVMADLGIWFAQNVFFRELTEVEAGPIDMLRPVWTSVDGFAVVVAVASGLLLFGARWGILRVLGAAAAGGLGLWLLGLVSL